MNDSIRLAVDVDLSAIDQIDNDCSAIASVSAEQVASIALHKRFGFRRVAYLTEAANKRNTWLDLTHMQLMLRASHAG